MGRKVRRVPLDFDWPIEWPESQWKGYFNPYWKHRTRCPHCSGTGASPLSRALENLWFGHDLNASVDARFITPQPKGRDKVLGLIGHVMSQPPAVRKSGHFDYSWQTHLDQEDVDALWEHNRLRDFGNKDNGDECPTAEDVNRWAADSGIGHDAINRWICIEHRCESFGVEQQCKYCSGSGDAWDTPEHKEAHDNWEPYDPPTGEGWQLWETTSEGSPITPVFETPEALAQYMADEGKADYDTAISFITSGYDAPSQMITKYEDGTGTIEDGVEFIGRNIINKEKEK